MMNATNRKATETKTCPICCRAAEAPYRRIVDGRIVEGCVDACHGKHLAPGTASHAWHFRPDADKCREKL